MACFINRLARLGIFNLFDNVNGDVVEMNKLDLIIDVLDGITNGNYNPRLAKEALAAARELRALEPVAWADWSLDGCLLYTSDAADE